MNKDLANINLNLLMALDALLKEKHVTNAGKRLNITQSAMSNLLKQLREIFKDELFIRGQSSRLMPTDYAITLEPKVAEAIEVLTQIFIEPEIFNPQDKQTITLGLSDYTELLFLPHLVQHILKETPGVSLVIKHLTYIKNITPFENDEIDMAIGIFRHIPEALISQTLYSETVVCMGAKENPLLRQPISKIAFAEAKHFIVGYTESRAEMNTEIIIKEMGRERNAVVVVPNAIPAINSMIGTELITVVMKRIADQLCYQTTFASQQFDFDFPTFNASLVWHPKHKNNAAHKWLRDLILQIAKII